MLQRVTAGRLSGGAHVPACPLLGQGRDPVGVQVRAGPGRRVGEKRRDTVRSGRAAGTKARAGAGLTWSRQLALVPQACAHGGRQPGTCGGGRAGGARRRALSPRPSFGVTSPPRAAAARPARAPASQSAPAAPTRDLARGGGDPAPTTSLRNPPPPTPHPGLWVIPSPPSGQGAGQSAQCRTFCPTSPVSLPTPRLSSPTL